jgi:hypothetical protein
MKVNQAALPDPQTTPVQSSLPGDAETFHVSLHTPGQFRRVLDFFDMFMRRDTIPAWKIDAERHSLDKAA